MDPLTRFLHNGLVSLPLRISLPVLLLCGLLSFATHISAKTKPSPAASADHDYVLALAAANHLLNAWETQDSERGLVLLTDAAKHQSSEDRLQAFFSPSSATQRAHEIRGGKKLKDGRYGFPVTLFEIAAGQERKWTHPRFSRILVIKAGKDDWVIDKLP